MIKSDQMGHDYSETFDAATPGIWWHSPKWRKIEISHPGCFQSISPGVYNIAIGSELGRNVSLLLCNIKLGVVTHANLQCLSSEEQFESIRLCTLNISSYPNIIAPGLAVIAAEGLALSFLYSKFWRLPFAASGVRTGQDALTPVKHSSMKAS